MAATNGPTTPTTNTISSPAAAAATAIAAAASQSPRSPSGIARTASPPWSQVVRGPEPEPVVAPSSPPANVAENTPESGENNAVVSKKPAWNKKPMSTPSPLMMNGEAAETGGAAVVMGAEQWPSLSECTKVSPKLSSSSDFSKNPGSGSIPSPLVIGINTSSTTSSTTQKPTTSNSNHHSTSNHGRAARQKSMKRDGGGTSQSNGVLSHPTSQSAGEGSHHHNNHGSAKPNSGSSSDVSGRDNVQNHSQRESGQRNTSGEHLHQRNTFRRGNGGSHSRGDGSHQNYGGRRSDMEPGNHDWNHQRSFSGRDTPPVQPRGGLSRGFVRVQPGATPFVHPAPAPLLGPPPFMSPPMDMNFFYLPPGVQFVPPVPSMFYPTLAPELYPEIMNQINYYFSNENLVRDTYLRGKMDVNGWVSVDVIAEFNRVKNLTTETYQILEAVRPSLVVEVQGDKIRRRDDWQNWLLPPPQQNAGDATSSGSQPPEGPAVSAATDHIQRVSLDGQSNNPSIVETQLDSNAAILHASSGDSSSSPQSRVDEASPGAC